MNPRYREPWGDTCDWPREDPTPDDRDDDTAPYRLRHRDTTVDEYAAHDAARHRERVIRNAVGRGGL